MNIQFKFSKPYEKTLNPKADPSTYREIEEKLEVMTTFWNTEGGKIEKTFKEVTGLEFTDEIIPCYLNSQASLSDPLSLRVVDILDMKDNLIHEFCHVFFRQNHSKISKGWEAMFSVYSNEPFLTKVHIGVHALHYLVVEKLMPERLSNIVNYSKKPTYVKAWEIVKKETPQKIVDLIFNFK